MLHRRAPLGERAQLRVDGAAGLGRRRLFSVVGEGDHLGLQLAQLAGLALVVHCFCSLVRTPRRCFPPLRFLRLSPRDGARFAVGFARCCLV